MVLTALARTAAGVSGHTEQKRFYDRLMSLEWEQTIVDARDPRALGLCGETRSTGLS